MYFIPGFRSRSIFGGSCSDPSEIKIGGYENTLFRVKKLVIKKMPFIGWEIDEKGLIISVPGCSGSETLLYTILYVFAN